MSIRSIAIHHLAFTFAMVVAATAMAALATASAAAPESFVDGAPAAAAASQPTTGPLGAPVTDAITRERLESMLALGDEAMVVQSFRRHPGRVLSFIDGYLEEGLAMLEKSEQAADVPTDGALPTPVLELYRLALRFAALADRAFGETIFVEYAATFASWSPAERKRFREGQQLYGAGRKIVAEDAAAALDSYRRSMMLAESVGDHWGMAMAQDGIADAAARSGRMDEAHEAAIKAVSLNGRLQRREPHIRSMLTAGRLQSRMQLPGGGVQYLLLARQLLPVEADPALRNEVVETLIPALEAAGRTADVERIQKEEARRAELFGA